MRRSAPLFTVIVLASVLLPTVPGVEVSATEAEANFHTEQPADPLPTRVSTGPVGLGPESRGFTSVSIDASGLCMSMLTARGDIWIFRDDSTLPSFGCQIPGGKSFGSASAGDFEPTPEIDVFSAGTDDFVALVYSDSGRGRWQFTASGQVKTYGDAEFFGDLHSLGVVPTEPVVAAVVLRDGSGYWLVASDGGVFAFGEARFFGSLPGALIGLGLSPTDLAAPIVAMSVSSDGAGYLLFGADGGVFAFGTAEFRGSLPGLGAAAMAATADIVGAIGWSTQPGYTLVSSAGQTVNFGGPDMGDLSDLDLTEPIVAVAATPDDQSMLMLDASGRLYPFGRSFICRAISRTGCSTNVVSGVWRSIEIAGLRISDDRSQLEFVPATRQLRSCTELRGLATVTGSTLVVDLQQRPIAIPCTSDSDLAGDDFTTFVHLDRPLPEGVEVLFEPTALDVPFEGTLSEVDLVRRRRSQHGLRTTPLEAELLLLDPDFAANWDANVALTTRELRATSADTSQLARVYKDVVRRKLKAAGLERVVVQIFQSDRELIVRVLGAPDPVVDLDSVVADAFAEDRVCVEYLYQDCVAMASTRLLHQIDVEIVGLDGPTPNCRDIEHLQLTGAHINWAETADALSEILGSLSIRLSGRTINDQDAGPIMAAGADAADSLVLPPLWEGQPPWADSPAINEAWALAEIFAAGDCQPPGSVGGTDTCDAQTKLGPSRPWPYAGLFARFGYDLPQDLPAAQELLDAVFCHDRDYLREHGYVVPPDTPFTDLSLIAILLQMPRSISGQPAPTTDRVISATGQDLTASATFLIETYGMSPEEALRSLVLQTIYTTFAPFIAENFSSRSDSAGWRIDHENGSRLELASATDEGVEAARELLADTGLDFTVIRVPFTKLELKQVGSDIITGLLTDVVGDPAELARRLRQITDIDTNVAKGEVVVTLSPLAPNDIRDLVVQLVDMYEPARLVIG